MGSSVNVHRYIHCMYLSTESYDPVSCHRTKLGNNNNINDNNNDNVLLPTLLNHPVSFSQEYTGDHSVHAKVDWMASKPFGPREVIFFSRTESSTGVSCKNSLDWLHGQSAPLSSVSCSFDSRSWQLVKAMEGIGSSPFNILYNCMMVQDRQRLWMIIYVHVFMFM